MVCFPELYWFAANATYDVVLDIRCDEGKVFCPYNTFVYAVSYFEYNQYTIMARMNLTPLATLRVSKYQIPRHNLLPNTSIQNHPLVIYHRCFSASTSASAIEGHLKDVGVVVPQWRYTMYTTTHFHSTTHEVLCVSSGQAKLCRFKIYRIIPTAKWLFARLWWRTKPRKSRDRGPKRRCYCGACWSRSSLARRL